MVSFLSWRSETRADDADRVSPLGVHDNEGTLPCRSPNGHEALFVGRMQRILDGDGQWIAEDRRRLLEGDAVLLQIVGRLAWVPFELHTTHRWVTGRTTSVARHSPSARQKSRAIPLVDTRGDLAIVEHAALASRLLAFLDFSTKPGVVFDAAGR